MRQQFPLHPTHPGSFCTNKMPQFLMPFVHAQLGMLLLLNHFHSISNRKLLLFDNYTSQQLNGPNLFCRVRGSCKHVAGICHHIIAKIAGGENVSVTSREQAWDLPCGKHQHEPDFLRNIKIKKIKGRL